MKIAIFIAAIGASFATPTTFAGNDIHWTYQGHTGAAHWAELDQNFMTCKTGKNQSPINIEVKKLKAGASRPINFSYQDTEAEVVNNGHTIQVNLKQAGKASFSGPDFTPVQFHFHTRAKRESTARPIRWLRILCTRMAKAGWPWLP